MWKKYEEPQKRLRKPNLVWFYQTKQMNQNVHTEKRKFIHHNDVTYTHIETHTHTHIHTHKQTNTQQHKDLNPVYYEPFMMIRYEMETYKNVKLLIIKNFSLAV